MSIRTKIRRAAGILRRGGLVAFPTETVYGLGACLSCKGAVRKIYSLKGRPRRNPLIVHISDRKQLSLITEEIPAAAKELMDEFWPGPLTMVFRRSKAVPSVVTAGLETVAVRMPSHPVARALIRELREPVAAPSANISGRPSPTRYEDVVKELGDGADLILDGGQTKIGLESTVIDMTQKPVRLLRPGSVTLETLRRFIPGIVPYSGNGVSSPGMKYRHYRPDCRVIMVRPEKWNARIKEWLEKEVRIGVLSYSKSIPSGRNIIFEEKFSGDKSRFARRLYALFFDAEKAGVQVLLVESVDKKGIGLAIMDRLSRAGCTGGH